MRGGPPATSKVLMTAGALGALPCQGTLALATMVGFAWICAKVASSRSIISRSRRRAVRPPITTAMTCVLPRHDPRKTRLRPEAPV